MLRTFAPLVVATLVIACSSSGRTAGATSGAGSQLQGSNGGACSVPATANTFDDASDHGCFPTSGEKINGANACTPSEYGMTCQLGSTDASMPQPADALQCKVIPIPTPYGVTFYCCPCGS
jgi:hypothetical protein